MENASTNSHVSESGRYHPRNWGIRIPSVHRSKYGPDLNPIELGFNVYKASLKRNSDLFKVDWYSAHQIALDSVTRDICIKEFRRCGVPGSYEIHTAAEEDEVAIAISIALDLV